MSNRNGVLVCLLIAGLAAPVARAQTDLSKFPLLKAVPADAFITVAARENAERKFVDTYWSDVMASVHESEILLDVWDMISESIPDERLDEFEETKDRLVDLCEKVAWGDLLAREMVHCGRLMSLPAGRGRTLLYEGMLLGRMSKSEAEKNFTAIRDVMKETIRFLNTMSEDGELARLDESEAHGAKIARVIFVKFEAFGLCVAQRGDVIAMTFGGTKMMDDALSLLASGGEGGLAATDRFRKAFDKLPPAEDSAVFFDAERMMSTFRALFPVPRAAATQPAQLDPELDFFNLMGRLMDDVSIVDYVAAVSWTDGHRTFEDTYTRARDGGSKSMFYQAIATERPLDRFERYIPREADSFSVSAGISLSKLYDWVISMVENNLSEGKQYVEHWNTIQQDMMQLNVKRDVLDLLDGYSVSVTLGDDWVHIMKITDTEKLKTQIDRLVKLVNTHAAQMFGPNAIELKQIRIGKHGDFHQISVPMMAAMMMGQGGALPIIGYSEGSFFIGSSKAALRKCLNTAAGEHPDITQSERWKAESVVPKGRVVAVSFTDEMRYGEEMQAFFNETAMALNMVQLMPLPIPPEFKKIIDKVGPFLPKLAKISERFDFYRSSATFTERLDDGWLDRTVQNYKSPAEVKKERDRKEAERKKLEADMDADADAATSGPGSGG